MRARTTSLHHAFSPAVMALALTILSTACVPKKAVQDAPEPSPPVIANIESMDVVTMYSQGLGAFWSGDYKTASTLFETLARRQDDEIFRAKALYGLACTKLAAARNPGEFEEARAVWREWERLSSGATSEADARMISPFLLNPKLFAPVGPAAQAKTVVKSGAADPELTKRLQEKEKEVLQLQKQIKALEAIHREIQAKKKMSQ